MLEVFVVLGLKVLLLQLDDFIPFDFESVIDEAHVLPHLRLQSRLELLHLGVLGFRFALRFFVLLLKVQLLPFQQFDYFVLLPQIGR